MSMSRNLVIVQKTARVLEIICKVVSILCLVGLIGCVVGAVMVGIFHFFPDVKHTVESRSGYGLRQIFGACVCGSVVSAAGFVGAKAHKDYFAMEQKAGTPFTTEGAKAFRTLGILNIALPIGTAILTAIIAAIFKCWGELRADFSLGVGIAMILLSFVFAYGAELEEKAGGEDPGKPEVSDK